jgi:chromosome segregation ATPase
MGDLSLSGGLGSGDLTLGSLGGGLGTLSKLSDLDSTPGGAGESLLAESMPRNDKKLQEVEANVNDLKSHMESTDMATKAMKSEMDNIKNDLSQINESIRTLLNVYEAVSRQYNPFVEGEPSAPSMPLKAEEKADINMSLDDIELEQPAAEAPKIKVETAFKEHEVITPFDDEGPLDRIVRPDEEEEIPLTQEEPIMKDLKSAISDRINDLKSEEPVMKPAPASRASVPASRTSYHVDIYALEQTRRLIDHLMGKICTERTVGNEISEDDVTALDLWMGEFKRLGGL